MSDKIPKKMSVMLPLTKNMRGPEVLKIQQWLNDLNDFYLFNKKERIPENSNYDNRTISMIKSFQKFAGLPNNGVYGSNTHDLVEQKFFNMLDILMKSIQRRKQLTT